MTTKQARKTLREKGINWTWYMDLRNINEKTEDKDIKRACHVLMEYILRG